MNVKDMSRILCPKCGRYLASLLPGSRAMCPKCGVWAEAKQKPKSKQ